MEASFILLLFAGLGVGGLGVEELGVEELGVEVGDG
jgi:hypothetical protein